MAENIEDEKAVATSIQRAAMIFVGVFEEFRRFLLDRKHLTALLKKLDLFKDELFDPNL